jgi:LmbE family N-acetylglucosaminyl deacetylase
MKQAIKLLICLLPFLFWADSYAFAEIPDEKPVAIFYSPHQDDEVLTMGHAITRYVQEGYEVHVVLLTDGSASASIHSVNKKMSENYLKPLSTQEFSYARNLEFVRSLTTLGVKRQNIHLSRLKDGHTVLSEVEEIVLKYKTRYPDAMHMAFSYHDDHIDHRNSGLALESLYENGIIQTPKFYIQNREHSQLDGEYEPFQPIYGQYVQEATTPYLDWNPLRRMYSIGAISVPYDFKLLEREPRSKYHGPGI